MSTYATTEQLSDFMFLTSEIPSLDSATPAERVNETVGIGDDSNTIFFLDNSRILSDTYTLYYGSSEATATDTLTETTHYSLNLDTGKIILTSAGVTLLGTNTIYAKYKYSQLLKNSQFQDALDRAQSDIDDDTNNHWANITDVTPDWNIITNSKQRGKGRFDKDYYIDHPPIPNVSTQLNGAVTALDATITVDSTNGFPESGIFGVSNLKVSYTGKTSTTFTGCTGVTTDVDDDTKVYPYVFEVSNTDQGSEPSYTIMKPGIDYDLDLVSGRIYLYNEQFLLDITTLNSAPNRLVPDRFRATYISGESKITDEIERLCLMIASKDLMHGAVRKAHATGRNNFEPALVDVDDKWINNTISKNTILGSDNT